jgi:hypothetical protein
MSSREPPLPSSVPAIVTHDLVVEGRRARRRHALHLLKLTAKIWLKYILPLLFVTTCGASILFTPCFVKSNKCRSRQSEAKSNLKSLFVAQEAFRAEYDRYSTSFEELGWEPRGSLVRYRYVVEHAAAQHFSALAVALEPEQLAGDVWRMTDRNDLTNLVNRCE